MGFPEKQDSCCFVKGTGVGFQLLPKKNLRSKEDNQSWKPPEVGVIKANFDASVHQIYGTGLGVIYRGSFGSSIGSSFNVSP